MMDDGGGREEDDVDSVNMVIRSFACVCVKVRENRARV